MWRASSDAGHTNKHHGFVKDNIEWALTSQRRSRLGDPGRQQESVAGIGRAGDLSRGQQAHERRKKRLHSLAVLCKWCQVLSSCNFQQLYLSTNKEVSSQQPLGGSCFSRKNVTKTKTTTPICPTCSIYGNRQKQDLFGIQ